MNECGIQERMTELLEQMLKTRLATMEASDEMELYYTRHATVEGCVRLRLEQRFLHHYHRLGQGDDWEGCIEEMRRERCPRYERYPRYVPLYDFERQTNDEPHNFFPYYLNMNLDLHRKWVYTKKISKHGEVIRYRPRLVTHIPAPLLSQ